MTGCDFVIICMFLSNAIFITIYLSQKKFSREYWDKYVQEALDHGQTKVTLAQLRQTNLKAIMADIRESKRSPKVSPNSAEDP